MAVQNSTTAGRLYGTTAVTCHIPARQKQRAVGTRGNHNCLHFPAPSRAYAVYRMPRANSGSSAPISPSHEPATNNIAYRQSTPCVTPSWIACSRCADRSAGRLPSCVYSSSGTVPPDSPSTLRVVVGSHVPQHRQVSQSLRGGNLSHAGSTRRKPQAERGLAGRARTHFFFQKRCFESRRLRGTNTPGR